MPHVPDRSRLPDLGRDWQIPHPDTIYQDGQQLLAAVPVRGTNENGFYYELSVIRIRCDEDFFEVELSTGDPWCWNFSDVDLYIALN
jgi:hypothetical protein